MSGAEVAPTGAADARGGRRALGWAGSAVGGAVLRILLLVGATAALGRMLSAEDFGAASLALSVVAVLLVFASGLPFEDALVQKRGLRRRDLGSALGASWVVGAACLGLAALLGDPLGQLVGAPDLRGLLLLGCLTLFAQAVVTVLTALARRRRRFVALAVAETTGAACGAAAALLAAALAPGPEALVLLRVATAVGAAAALAIQLGVLIAPRLSPVSLRSMGRFSLFLLAQKLVEDVSYLMMNYLVGLMFGLAALGHFNMAMRIIDPVRGAAGAIGHNIVFAQLRPAIGDMALLATRARDAAAAVAMITAPIILGLGAVSPLLLPLIVGPGWDDAAWNAMALSFGTSLLLPPLTVMTAAVAAGRPEFYLRRRLAGFAALVAVLPPLALTPVGPLAAGVGRASADLVEAAYALRVHRGFLGGSVRDLVGAIARPWGVAAAMAFAAWAIGGAAATAAPAPVALACAVAGGALLYVGGLAIAAPALFAQARALLLGR